MCVWPSEGCFSLKVNTKSSGSLWITLLWFVLFPLYMFELKSSLACVLGSACWFFLKKVFRILAATWGQSLYTVCRCVCVYICLYVLFTCVDQIPFLFHQPVEDYFILISVLRCSVCVFSSDSCCWCVCVFLRLLLVGGCESGDSDVSRASRCGITAWRVLSGSPHYKQVTSYEDDISAVSLTLDM